MVKMIYRSALLTDIPQLVKLRALMQCEVNAFDPSEVTTDFISSTEEYFLNSLNNQSYYSAVAEFEGSLVAANGLVIYQRPPSLIGPSGLVGYVTNVYTLPEFRGRGIAGELMKILIQFAKNANVAKLHLGATKAGKSVYERVGFKPVKFEALELKF